MKKVHWNRGPREDSVPGLAYPTLQEKFSVITRSMIAQVMDFDEQPREHTICFTGHRKLDAREARDIQKRLDQLLPVCYHKGYRVFLTGGALGFDILAAEAVHRLRMEHDDVKLILVLPCADQSCRWSEADCERYERMLYCADEIRVLSPAYYEGCMMNRNRHMVDHSSLCLCYLNKFKGGTVSTVAYAMKVKTPILNVAMEDACAAYIAQNS